MTREEALEKLKELESNDDLETSHIEADEVLCELLRSLGYEDVAEAFDKLDRWYA